jgi:hypothetical protein
MHSSATDLVGGWQDAKQAVSAHTYSQFGAQDFVNYLYTFTRSPSALCLLQWPPQSSTA